MKATTPHLKDPYLQKTLAALLRASENARLLAEKTGTPFIVCHPEQSDVEKKSSATSN